MEESFYAQHQLEALDIEVDLLTELKNAGTGKTEVELRQLLGCFLFSGDDVFKKIKVLSGGEKARVALAKVIAAKGNFLMLDEPTNHLDMQSVEMLIEALNKYEGTLILVSHDRYFISKTANKIWHIENGKIKEFNGGYEEWVQWEAEQEKRKAALNIRDEKPVATPKPQEPKPAPKHVVNTQEQQQLKRELQNKTKTMQKAEADMDRLKTEKVKIEAQLADPAIYADRNAFQKLDGEYKSVADKLTVKEKEYEQLFEAVMELEGKIG